MAESEVKDILNSIITEDLNLKDIIRSIDRVALDEFEIDLNPDKHLQKLTTDAICSMEATRNLLLKLAKSIDELYGKSRQHEFGKELNNYTDQFFKSEDMYKVAVASTSQRIRSLDRSKLFRRQMLNSEADHQQQDKGDSIRQRLRRNYFQQSIAKSNQLVSDLKQVAAEFSQQAEVSRKTLDVLNEDSETLMRTHGTYQKMDANINIATRLVGKYNRREIWDKILISVAFLFFLLVCGYIVIKRISRKI